MSTTLTVKTYNLPNGINACYDNEECQTILVLPPGHFTTDSWCEIALLDSYPGVTLVSQTTRQLPDWWTAQADCLYGETAVPPNRTRTYSIAPDGEGRGIDMILGELNLRVQCPVGTYKTSDRGIQRALAAALITNPRIVMTADVAT
jgi:hypothetical protein